MISSQEYALPKLTTMTLEQRSLATKWQTLLNASFKNILDYYETHTTIPGGLMCNNIYTEKLVRKVAVTYGIANIALLYGARLFGGFCSAHFSGIPTEDLDIYIPKKTEKNLFISALPQFMAMAFDVPITSIVFEESEKYSAYCTSYVFQLQKKEVVTKVNIDIASTDPSVSELSPVSWGRSICYDNCSGFHIQHLKLLKFKMDVLAIQKFLSSGSDILITKSPKELSIQHHCNYLEYYATRIKRLHEQGYKLILPAAHVPSFIKKSERIMQVMKLL